MRKLLEELQKTDPDFYDEIARDLEQVDIEYEEDIIQGACQRAIAARKWSLSQHSTMWYEGEQYDAEIYDLDADVIGESTADSSAESILSAYLSAIRRQP